MMTYSVRLACRTVMAPMAPPALLKIHSGVAIDVTRMRVGELVDDLPEELLRRLADRPLGDRLQLGRIEEVFAHRGAQANRA